jgi:hypothetical protein
MLAIKVWQNFMKTARHHSKNRNIMRWPKEKREKSCFGAQRILIEHIFRKLKAFCILGERYRNRRKIFAFRFSLIAALYNLELASS